MHALYGFARYADEFVDSLTDPRPDELRAWSQDALADLRGGTSDDPVVAALGDTMRRWDIPLGYVEAFLASMQMDIDVTSYATYADLQGYMHGSAAVIGLQMVPILEPLPTYEREAQARAKALGEAFQLTNFIRDVGEDLDRGRVYLPAEDCARFGVTRADLERRELTPSIEALLRFEADRARSLYAYAAGGVTLLHPTSRDCIRTAILLYGGILDAVADAGYDVLSRRVSVSLQRRLAVALPAWERALRARSADRGWHRLPPV